MDVGGWLRSLGLAQYEDAFRNDAIDDSILPSLTAEDLKDLGVGSVGHRRKLLDAIVALRARCGMSRRTLLRPSNHPPMMPPSAASSPSCSATWSVRPRSRPASIRKTCAKWFRTYHRCVTDTVRRFGGFVAQYMGDGVLVYFGYPRAHEHDAERAVRAGLELVDAVASA